MTAAEVMEGAAVRSWVRLAADALGQSRSAIDLLNVFPVADSDTGTNLHKTFGSAAEALDRLPAHATAADIWRTTATAAMRGACGNSGIIASQLLHGLADACGQASPCDGRAVADGLARAAALARAAVHRPVEGTILTVADAAAQGAGTAAAQSGALADVGRAAAVAARQALDATRDQLDVLAASGVVDAGGAGLCVVLDALSEVLSGWPERPLAVPVPAHPRAAPGAAAESPFRYEVTFLLDARADAVTMLRDDLDLIGDSLVVSGSDPQWHVHAHVADAGAAIEAGLSAGRLSKITITYLNGTPGHPPARQPAAPSRVLAVAEGQGLSTLLRRAGAIVAESREPAALAELSRSPEPVVLVATPGRLVSHWPRDWPVLEIGCVIQSLAALAVHDAQRDPDADLAAMARAAAGMRWASLSAAADGELAGTPPTRYVACIGGQLAASGTDQLALAGRLADQLLDTDTEMVTVLTGQAADARLGEFLASHIAERAPAVEVICYEGGMTGDVLLIGAE